MCHSCNSLPVHLLNLGSHSSTYSSVRRHRIKTMERPQPNQTSENPRPSQTTEDPQPYQIQHYPVDGDMQHLFTKTLDEDDMWGITLVGNSNDHLRKLPKSLLSEIATKGLELEVYTPGGTFWVGLRYNQRARTRFNLDKIDWLEVACRNGFRVGDTIHCWSLYHAEVGPVGILSLLFQKAANEEARNVGGDGNNSS